MVSSTEIANSVSENLLDKQRRLEQAETLFITGLDLYSIQKMTQLPTDLLRVSAYGDSLDMKDPMCWFAKRERAMTSPDSLVRTYRYGAENVYSVISAISTGIISQSLRSIVTSGRLDPNSPNYDPPSISDLAALSQISAQAKKDERLERGESTSKVTVDVSSISMRDIVAIREKHLYGGSLDMVRKINAENPKSAQEIWEWEQGPED